MKRTFKLETYLLVTNLLQGIFWISSGILGCLNNTPRVLDICFLVLAFSFLILYFFIIYSKREPFDEFSQNIMDKTNSTVLIILMLIMPFSGIFADFYSFTGKEIVIPWYALVKIIAGFAYCARYVVFMIMEKQLLDNTAGEENVKN